MTGRSEESRVALLTAKQHQATPLYIDVVSKRGKFFEKLMSGQSDTSIAFGQLCELLRWLGFDEHVRGDHHIFSMSGVQERINLQPSGRAAKGYQVRQVRDMLIRQRMSVE